MPFLTSCKLQSSSMSRAMSTAAAECVAACPTAALAFKESGLAGVEVLLYTMAAAHIMEGDRVGGAFLEGLNLPPPVYPPIYDAPMLRQAAGAPFSSRR